MEWSRNWTKQREKVGVGGSSLVAEVKSRGQETLLQDVHAS